MPHSDETTASLLPPLATALMDQNLVLITAESCTGGLIAAAVTSVSGSSQWFDRGFVTYSNQSKMDLLGVSGITLEQFGAVSRETVVEMLNGALKGQTNVVAVAVSGVAGPSGGTPGKPVGTVYIGWQQSNRPSQVSRFQFNGDREAVRSQTVLHALQGLLERLRANTDQINK